MNSDGTNVTNVTNDPGFDWGAAWSPDGSRLAFRSNRPGNVDVFIMSIDGTGVTNLTNSPQWDGTPLFSPDGRKIAFDSERDGDS